jgi:hypothetical protein
MKHCGQSLLMRELDKAFSLEKNMALGNCNRASGRSAVRVENALPSSSKLRTSIS